MELVLDPITEPGVTLATSVLLPDDQHAWISRALRIDDLELVSESVAKTRTGWPLRIVIARIADTWRAYAFYAFFEHAAIAMVSGGSREVIERCLDALRSGRPRWTDDIAALVQLWDVDGPIGLL